jgi:hypothetical protein
MAEYNYGGEVYNDQHDRMPRQLANEAEKLGMTKAQAKTMLRADTSNLESYRKWKKSESKKGR